MGPRLHPYSLENRTGWTLWLVVAGIVAALLFGLTVDWLQIKIPAWVDTPGTLGMYGILYVAVDQVAAKFAPTRWLLGIPRFTGKYDVAGMSDAGGKFIGTAEIRQTWSNLCVHMSFDASESWSEAAHAVEIGAGGGHQLMYLYRNQPKTGQDRRLHSHVGTAWLRLSEDGQSLVGEYYTGHNRETKGTLTLKRRT